MTLPNEKRRGSGTDRSSLWAILLIAVGVLFLAGNLGWLPGLGGWIWALLFAVGGAAFLAWFARDRSQWWALIPGSALFGLSAAIVGGAAGGGAFLALLGAGFGAIYWLERTRWWAIIPGGVLLTLGIVAWLDTTLPRFDAGWVFFLGLAATFGALYVLPEQKGRQRWAIYPALATLALALVILASGAVTGVVVPLLLIAAGAYLLWQRSDASSAAQADRPESSDDTPRRTPQRNL